MASPGGSARPSRGGDSRSSPTRPADTATWPWGDSATRNPPDVLVVRRHAQVRTAIRMSEQRTPERLERDGGTPVRGLRWPPLTPGGLEYGDEEKRAAIEVI